MARVSEKVVRVAEFVMQGLHVNGVASFWDTSFLSYSRI